MKSVNERDRKWSRLNKLYRRRMPRSCQWVVMDVKVSCNTTRGAQGKDLTNRAFVVFGYVAENQYPFIDFKNTAVIGKPEREPRTLSTPQRGQIAVCPTLSSSSWHHSRMSDGLKVPPQEKHPQISLCCISSRWKEQCLCASITDGETSRT